MKKADMERLEDKLDGVKTDISAINVTLAKQSVILDEHVKRTNLLEEQLKPVEDHVKLIKSIAKIVSFIGMGVILKILHTLVTK